MKLLSFFFSSCRKAVFLHSSLSPTNRQHEMLTAYNAYKKEKKEHDDILTLLLFSSCE